MSRKEQAYQQLKEMIISGELKQGSPLIETELTEWLNMSRTPIREALNELEKDDLVEQIPRIGTFVTRISRQDIIDIYDLRIALETLALEKAFARLNRPYLAQLRDKVLALDGAFDRVRSGELNKCIHQEWIQRSENQRLMYLLEQLALQIARMTYISFSEGQRQENFIKEHVAIIDAILADDLTGALQALREHLENLKSYTVFNEDVIDTTLTNLHWEIPK